jgi:FKBP-type peptidyl-prolyl cis-trans isomerase
MFFFAVAALVNAGTPIALTEDGRLTKIVLRPGTGPKPTDDAHAVIHYTGCLSDGTTFDSSRDRSPFQFKIGRGVIRGWSIGVLSMAVGEIANFTMEYDYGYGERGYPPIVPPKAQLTFEIELVNLVTN